MSLDRENNNGKTEMSDEKVRTYNLNFSFQAGLSVADLTLVARMYLAGRAFLNQNLSVSAQLGQLHVKLGKSSEREMAGGDISGF